MADAAIELGEFFDYFYGEREGWAYVPLKHSDLSWTKGFFKWPSQRKGMINYVIKNAAGPSDIYFAPVLFSRTSPDKKNVLGSQVLWVDFDGNAPVDWPADVAPEPTLIVQSSLTQNQHCYWLLDEVIDDIDLLEDRNRALALALKADTSGWDADQILRPPHTLNQKIDPAKGRTKPLPVHIVRWER